MTVSDHTSALHRASHVPNDTMGARRSIRVFVTRHTGSDRNFTCQIKHRVRIHKNPPCFIAYFYADCQGTKRAERYQITPHQRPSVRLNTFPFVSNFFCMVIMPPFDKQQYHELTNIASVFSKNQSKILILVLILIFIILNRRVADFQTLRDFLFVDLLTEL